MAETTILAILEPLVGKFGEYLVNPIKNQLSYLCCYSCNVQRLANEVPELNTRRESVQQDVDAAKDNLEVIRPEVRFWLTKVEVVQTMSNRIRNDAAEAQKSCFSKWCPLLHYSLSRDARKTTEASIELRKTEFKNISNPVNLADLEPIPATSELEFQSRDLIEKKILDAFKDDSVYSIGLCGMGGVGKTTMARKIERSAREKTTGFMFERVVMAVVSQQPDLSKIQQQIAEGLGLRLNKESLTIRATLLYNRLKVAANVLIILDDVWDRLDLEEIGIPSKSTHAGCKLLLTSRNQPAIISTVEDAKVISLEVLNNEESWNLFRKNVGLSIDSSDLHQIAKEVVAECQGLPLALVTLGRTLRGCRRKSSWEDTLRGLKQSRPRNIPGVLKDVYGPLRLSFERLESEEYRYLFLLCCLFPEDSEISVQELVRYGIGLGIFEGIEDLRQARDRVESIVDNLITRSLLIVSGTDRWGNRRVKMHDIIRDMGIYIASPEGKRPEDSYVFMISHGMKEWPKPKEDSYANYTCISLSFSKEDIDAPERICCPRLEFLNMYFDYYFELPENIFGGMTRLKVLEASRINSLLPSVHLLKSLRTLCLFNCELEKTSAIGELMNLEILCLQDCEIEVLQKEIGGLKRLRKLEVYNCRLRRIEFGVVSGLDRLEELVILGSLGSFTKWKAEQKDGASLVELDFLSHLTTLYIEISDPNIIPTRTPCWVQKLMKYFICVGAAAVTDLKFQKAIVVGAGVVTPLADWFYDMSVNATYLNLRGYSCPIVVNKLVRSRYQNLEYLQLYGFDNVQYLSNEISVGQQNGAMFPILKVLHLSNSSSLQGISSGPPPVGSFQALEQIRLERLPALMHLQMFPKEELCPVSNLKIMVINNCGSLLDLFPLSMAQSLSQLEKLKVSDCEVLKKIFKKEEGRMEITINKIEFPKLHYLKLENLPSLGGFCEGVERIDLSALRTLRISGIIGESDCDLHQKFLFDQQLSGILIIPLRSTFEFSGLQVLRVDSIHNIKSLFSPCILSVIPNLTELTIKNCTKLEEVIGKNENVVPQLPQLKELVLSGLPKILTFCHSTGDLELPSLEILELADCPLMETFVRPSDVGSSRTSCSENVNQPFFSKELSTIWLSGLQELVVDSLHNIKSLFSPYTFSGVPNLRELTIKNCTKLEEVIGKNENVVPQLPQLERLVLSGLPKILTFCHSTGDLELPSLEILELADCPLMETFVRPSDVGSSRTSCSENVNQPFFSKELSTIWLSGLQELVVDSLHNIKSLFSPYTFSGVPNLRELTIKNCTKLVEVIGKDENVVPQFPQLKILVLFKLPKILTFCHSTGDLELPSLRILVITDCPLMETFFMPSDVISSRTSCSENVNQPFFSKEVFCPKLDYLGLQGLNITNLFSLHAFRGLRNIEQLVLENCGKLQEVIVKKDDERSMNTKEILSFQLNNLRISKLPELRRFCNVNNDLEFPSLYYLRIENCPMLETFTVGNLHLPRLEFVRGDLDPDFAAKVLFNKQKSSNKIDLDNNCFTLSASDLSLNVDQQDLHWFLARDPSNSFVSVVRVLTSSPLEIKGNLEMEKLSAGVVYEIIFIIMLREYAQGWKEPVELKLTIAGGIVQHRTEILDKKKRKEWIEILVGEFTREPHQIGQLEFSLNKIDEEYENMLILKGAKIRQKA